MSDAELVEGDGRESSRDEAAAQAAADGQSGQSEEQADLAEQLEMANERALRAQAEFENFRKRTRREMDEQQRYASLLLVSDLLSVLDNLDRAVESAEQNGQQGGLLEGVKMVRSQLLNALQRHQCRPIEAEGAQFDPNLHEAIGTEPSDEHEAGVVTRVARVGYQLHDRVVRPSQVLISAGPSEPEAGAQDQAEQGSEP